MATGGSSSMRMQITESNENIHARQAFHERCGRRITLSNGNRTATRSVRDFSHALVFSAEPLLDDVLFEVVIEQKNLSWGGSIEIGVTTECPDGMDIPSCATVMRNGTWVMSGIDVRKDGMCLTEFYGTDLEMLTENDRVGVMRTSNNELLFFVNGESQGLAATNMPRKLWALVDLYGRCVQVSIYPNETDPIADGSLNEELSDPISIADINLRRCMDVNIDNANVFNNNNSMLTQNLCDVNDFNGSTFMTTSGVYSSPIANAIASSTCSSAGDCYDMNDRLRFHMHCGSLVKLTRSCRTAERCRPLDEFNNGVVMTHRPLRDNEMFEIRIDKLVDKWSGSIEVGVTTHNPSILHFPATMTNMRSGTIMMSGCGILTNGKGTRRQYGDFNLDELREGDRVGMMRNSNGSLCYYINGEDQGVAATRVASTLWGVIDLYGMTTKVTIVDHDGREQQNLITRRNNSSNFFNYNSNIANDLQNNENNDETCNIPVHPFISNEFTSELDIPDTIPIYQASEAPFDEESVLRFHPICGSHATITNNGKTALRPNAAEDFNNGVVLTRRPLYNNELFEVRLEQVVSKWAGSVEIGVTTFCPEELDFPFTMTNVRSGTWMMTGNGVMRDGITIFEQYGENLDRLQVGDRVGVIRKENGTLHFLVNGIDQGPAATHIPEVVYGVIDLYGQAAQASITENTYSDSPDTGNSTISNTTLYSDTPLKFHEIHGANVIITNNGLTASRPNALAEFNNAVVFSNRPLKQRELFEVVIENVETHWSGNIEIGVTGCRPDDILLSANAMEIDADDTIILCGPLTFHNRVKVKSNFRTDIDTLGAGSHIGVMRIDNFIHFYINGINQGSPVQCHSPYVWAIVDLYGQCAQVTIKHPVPSDMRAPYATSENSQSYQATSIIHADIQQNEHRWTCISGNAMLTKNCTMAIRSIRNVGALSRCLLFSEHHLVVGCPFEIKIVSYNHRFAGCFNIGVSDVNLGDYSGRKNVPFTITNIPANIWYISGNEIRQNSQLLRLASLSLDWLRAGDYVSLELTPNKTLKILFNSEDVNVQFYNVPNNVYVVVELQGSTIGIQTTSRSQERTSPLRPFSLRLQDSVEFGTDPLQKQDSMLESIDFESVALEFSEFCGSNIHLLENRRTAERHKSYNNGLVCVTKPLFKGDSISITIDTINPVWKGNIGLGAVGVCPTQASNTPLPTSILQLKRPCWVTTHDYININGIKSMSKYGAVLENITAGTVITMTLTHNGMFVVTVGSTSLEDLAYGILSHVYPVFDVYGKCERISIISNQPAVAAETADGPAVERAAQSAPNLNARQCEKADLEVYEKENEVQASTPNESETSWNCPQ